MSSSSSRSKPKIPNASSYSNKSTLKRKAIYNKSRSLRGIDQQIDMASVDAVRKELRLKIEAQLAAKIKNDPSKYTNEVIKKIRDKNIAVVEHRIAKSRDLLLAVRDGNMERAKRILESEDDLYFEFSLNNGKTALHILLESEDTFREAILLIEAGAPLLIKNKRLPTPFASAVRALEVCVRQANSKKHKLKFCERFAEALKEALKEEEEDEEELEELHHDIHQALKSPPAGGPKSLSALKSHTRKRSLSRVSEERSEELRREE